MSWQAFSKLHAFWTRWERISSGLGLPKEVGGVRHNIHPSVPIRQSSQLVCPQLNRTRPPSALSLAKQRNKQLFSQKIVDTLQHNTKAFITYQTVHRILSTIFFTCAITSLIFKETDITFSFLHPIIKIKFVNQSTNAMKVMTFLRDEFLTFFDIRRHWHLSKLFF